MIGVEIPCRPLIRFWFALKERSPRLLQHPTGRRIWPIGVRLPVAMTAEDLIKPWFEEVRVSEKTRGILLKYWVLCFFIQTSRDQPRPTSHPLSSDDLSFPKKWCVVFLIRSSEMLGRFVG